jgi:hypothetical protein
MSVALFPPKNNIFRATFIRVNNLEVFQANHLLGSFTTSARLRALAPRSAEPLPGTLLHLPGAVPDGLVRLMRVAFVAFDFFDGTIGGDDSAKQRTGLYALSALSRTLLIPLQYEQLAEKF